MGGGEGTYPVHNPTARITVIHGQALHTGITIRACVILAASVINTYCQTRDLSPPAYPAIRRPRAPLNFATVAAMRRATGSAL
jgi:hypothetical protein